MHGQMLLLSDFAEAIIQSEDYDCESDDDSLSEKHFSDFHVYHFSLFWSNSREQVTTREQKTALKIYS